MAQVDQITVLIRGEDQLSRPASAAARSLQDVDKAAHGADLAVAAVGETAARHTGALGGFASALSKIGLAGLGVQTALAGIKSVVGVFAGPVQAASDLSESMNKVDVVFGDSAKSVQDWAKTAAQAMGQSRAQALEAAGGFGNLFVSMGLGQKPAADLSKQIVMLGSDLASFNNIDPGEALEKLRAGLVGEAEPLRTLGVNLNEAAVQEEALRLGLAKNKDSITDAAKIQARYSLILKQTKTAQGDFARTATGMANAQRIISASFADLQTQIGERLLPVIAPLISSFAQWLPSAMDKLAPVLDRAGALFRDFAGGVGMVTEMLKTRGFLETLKELGLRAVPVLLQGFQSVRDLSGRIATWLRDQVAAINWTYVWYAVKNVAGGLVAGLGSVVDTVTAWLVQQWQAINWATVWGAVKNAGSGLLAALGSVAGSVTTWLGEQWAKIDWPAVWASVTGVADGLVKGLGSVWGSVTTWLTEQWGKIDWPAIWTSVTEHAKALEANLGTIVAELNRWWTTQFRGIGWTAVLAAANFNAAYDGALADALEKSDGQVVGRAVAAALKKAFLFGMGLTAQDSVTFDSGVFTFLTGLQQAWSRNEARRNQIFGQWAIDVVQGLVLGLLNAPNWGAVQTAIETKLRSLTPSWTPPHPDLSGVLGGGSPPADVKPGAPREGPTGPIGAYQHGGSFYVGGSGGPDSQMVAFRATPGERVDVRTPAQQRGGGGVNVVVHVGEVRDRGDADYLADVLPDALARALETARTQQGSPYAGGLIRFA